MQVRLTESGQKALGFLPDRKIATVTDKRAFALMSRGHAAKDKGFMSLFDGPLPKKEKADLKKAKEAAEKKKKAELLKAKKAKEAEKEKAASKKQKEAEKAVK